MDAEQADGEVAETKRVHSVNIIDSHMPAQKEKSALEIAIEAVDEHKQLMDIASHIKTKYDKQYPGSGKATEGVYHAIVGSRFASTTLASPPCCAVRGSPPEGLPAHALHEPSLLIYPSRPAVHCCQGNPCTYARVVFRAQAHSICFRPAASERYVRGMCVLPLGIRK